MRKNFDSRTKSRFKKDIKKASKIELDIIIRICYDIFKSTGQWPTLKPNGTDFTGNFVADLSKITSKPDFDVDGCKYEVTRSSKVCKKFFHEKENKVNEAIDNGHIIVYVNGIEEEKEPEYCCLGYDELSMLNILSLSEFGHTLPSMYSPVKSYKYKIDWIKKYCKRLPAVDLSIIPKEYKDLIKQCD